MTRIPVVGLGEGLYAQMGRSIRSGVSPSDRRSFYSFDFDLTYFTSSYTLTSGPPVARPPAAAPGAIVKLFIE